MKSSLFLSALILLISTLHSPASEARGHHHGGGNFGFYFGAPIYPHSYYRYNDPFYRYDPYYYSYPQQTIITVPQTPPTYIQQSPPVTTQNQPGYWYYCDNPEGYYPYVKECLNTWQPVEPTPPPTR